MSTEKFSREDFLRKLQAALKLGEEAKTEGEAEAAMAAAKRMMDKYGISMADVVGFKKDAKGTAEKTWTKKRETVMGESGKRQHIAQFEGWLASAVGDLTETVPLVHKGKRTYWSDKKHDYVTDTFVQLTFLGDELDVTVAAATLNMLLKACKSLARKRCGSGWTPKHRSFAEGFASGVGEKIRKMKDASRKQFDGTPDAETFALVSISKKDWLQGILSELGAKEAKARKTRGKLTAEYWDGLIQGQEADLSIKNKLDEE